MKRVLIAFIAVAFTSGMVGLAEADLISFLHPVQGIDPPGSSDFVSEGTKAHSYSLLDGKAEVAAYENSSDSLLYWRKSRGVGVDSSGVNEADEVDLINLIESIEITFDTIDYYVNSLEVRSLFAQGSVDPWGTEKGTVDFYLDGSKVYTENLVGQMSGGDGVLVVPYASPKLVDKLVFYVPTEGTSESEFAVAELDVEPIPEPGTLLLLGSGLVGLAGYGFRRRRKK